MAYDGELVRMANGRWARFQECLIYKGRTPATNLPILVAVELDDELQRLLDDSDEVRAAYGEGGPVRLELSAASPQVLRVV